MRRTDWKSYLILERKLGFMIFVFHTYEVPIKSAKNRVLVSGYSIPIKNGLSHIPVNRFKFAVFSNFKIKLCVIYLKCSLLLVCCKYPGLNQLPFTIKLLVLARQLFLSKFPLEKTSICLLNPALHI